VSFVTAEIGNMDSQGAGISAPYGWDDSSVQQAHVS
jgi:hypothetical protein